MNSAWHALLITSGHSLAGTGSPGPEAVAGRRRGRGAGRYPSGCRLTVGGSGRRDEIARVALHRFAQLRMLVEEVVQRLMLPDPCIASDQSRMMPQLHHDAGMILCELLPVLVLLDWQIAA